MVGMKLAWDFEWTSAGSVRDDGTFKFASNRVLDEASACYLLIESSFSIGNPRQPASRIESWVANINKVTHGKQQQQVR